MPSVEREEHARQRLLRAARRLLSDGGPTTATARAICSEAGVKAPTLYYYFDDLAALHRAAVNASFLEIMAGYRKYSRSAGPMSAIQRAWAAFLSFARSEPVMARLLIQSVLDDEPPAALRLTLRRLQADLESLQMSGELRIRASQATSILWTAAVGAVSIATMRTIDHEEFTSVSDLLLEAVMSAIANRSA